MTFEDKLVVNMSFFDDTIESEEFKNLSINYDELKNIHTPLQAFKFLNIHTKFMMNAKPDLSRDDAMKNAKSNIAYHAAYYNDEVRERIERLFNCEHPLFGKISVLGPPTADEAIELGVRAGSNNFTTLEQLRKTKQS